MKSSKGYKNHGKYTRKTFINYKNSFEKFISGDSEKIYNINQKGIPVENANDTTLHEYLESFCNEELNKDEIIQNISTKIPHIKSDEMRDMLLPFINDKKTLQELLKASLGDKITENHMNYFIDIFTRS